MRISFARVRRFDTFFILLILSTLLLASAAPRAGGQASAKPVDLSYQAFSQLARVYQAGGQAPDLVAKLNLALSMIDDAQAKRAQGDAAEANRIENQAASNIQSVLDSIPAAQEEAASNSRARTLGIFALVPLAVFLSTFIFYATLRVWRYYGKMKLYEMRIVEKKAED